MLAVACLAADPNLFWAASSQSNVYLLDRRVSSHVMVWPSARALLHRSHPLRRTPGCLPCGAVPMPAPALATCMLAPHAAAAPVSLLASGGLQRTRCGAPRGSW